MNKQLPFTSHFYITAFALEINVILGLLFIKTLNPNVYSLQIGNYKSRPMPQKKTQIKQVLPITEKVFGFEKEDLKIQLLSDTVFSKELTEFLTHTKQFSKNHLLHFLQEKT